MLKFNLKYSKLIMKLKLNVFFDWVMINAKISKLLAPKKLIFENVVLDDKNLLPEEIFVKHW